MWARKLITVAVFVISVLLVSVALACDIEEEAESYLALTPRLLHIGEKEAISLTLFKGDALATGTVEVALVKDGKTVVRADGKIQGKGKVELTIPEIEEGDYELQVRGNGFADKAKVKVEQSLLLFLQTDKPIYKPGQTIHIRAILLNSELKPVSDSVTVEVMDDKGIKIFRQDAEADEFGMVTLDLPISEEPNLGVWKIAATAQKSSTQLDVKVEEYVLPKYEVKVELAKEWFLASEPIEGKVKGEYSFGKPVSGELEIVASRYVGKWEEYATFRKRIEGETQFRLPAVNYVAGVPAAGGMGNVTLNIAIKEEGTGYEEKTTQLLTVSATSLNIEIIPESSIFKPSLPFNFLIVTETPNNQPLEAKVNLDITYLNKDFKEEGKDSKQVETRSGKAIVTITPPEESVALMIEASANGSRASQVVEAGYSPSGNFIHMEQISPGIPKVGEEIKFKVYTTKEAANFYYEVVARGTVAFTDFTKSSEIAFKVTPQMASTSKLLVYQILPNSEVAADYLPFTVEAKYPHSIAVEFSKDEVKPGDELEIRVQTEGAAKVGIAAVDRSVFILAENRLNLQQVFEELERLYMKPQAELHEVSIYSTIQTRGAQQIFDDAGVVVLSDKKIPQGKEYKSEKGPGLLERLLGAIPGLAPQAVEEGRAVFGLDAMSKAATGAGEGLAEVERIRQFFPETWIWQDLVINSQGKGSLKVTAPDTITTWKLAAVGISLDKGLGMVEDELKVFQPFFLSIDLPYSAVRGEEFPVQVALYNYLAEGQNVSVEIEGADWFDLLDSAQKTVSVAANNVGGTQFKIRPTKLGIKEVKIVARSTKAADAVIKKILIEPEGVARELVTNLVLNAGDSKRISTYIPEDIISDSGRAYLALTASYLTQTIEGLDTLLQMPFGCGEQNMILFAPDVYITKYLKESNQLKPEVMAKAEKLMITGYQRELTYRRNEGSFSAFGQSDKEGSLWLTAFVLKSFSQAKGLIYIDETILEQATKWITDHQNKDGSFSAIGFVHHQEMVGGVKGKTALTAYVSLALMEAGDKAGSARAVEYLEDELDNIDDAYTMAITTYALELAGSKMKDKAYEKLMKMAIENENGLHWSAGGDVEILTQPIQRGGGSSDIEATGYATLALAKHGDAFNAARAGKWLVSKRNAYGGFGSTQDTVVALQALTEYSKGARADVDLNITIETMGGKKELSIKKDNFDVLQVVEVGINEEIEMKVRGKGEAVLQVVRRFNLPQPTEEKEILKVDVDYDATQVAVNDLVKVAVEVEFAPPIPMEAGMVVLDVSVPTGFEPVKESLAKVLEKEKKMKRYEVAGRKVIFYIENMLAGDSISFSFQVKARYPVKAEGVSSTVYSYYQPEIKGEVLSKGITVVESRSSR